MDNKAMKMPAVALRGMVILPGMIAHFDVSREKSIHAVEQSMMDEQKIFLVAQRDVEQKSLASKIYIISVLLQRSGSHKITKQHRQSFSGRNRAGTIVRFCFPNGLFRGGTHAV